MAATDALRVFFQLESAGRVRWLRPGALVQEGSLEELSRCGASEWIWLLDARRVQSTRVTLPAANPRTQLQALPFALEDQVLGALEDQAITSRRLSRTEFAVALTERAALLEAHAALEAVGIGVNHCVADVQALPCAAGEWALLLAGDAAWLRCGESVGFRCPAAQWRVFFEGSVVEQGAPTCLRVFASGAFPAELEVLEGKLMVSREPAPADPLLLFAGAYQAGGGPDFVDSLPQRTRDDGAARRWWLASAAVLLLILFAHTGFLAFRASSLDTALTDARAGTEQTFRELFPQVTRLVDVRAQATQALAEQGARAAQGSAFLDLLLATGGQLITPDAGGLTLISASYERGALELRVRAPDMPGIERYQQRLQANALPVLTLSVEKRDDGAEASLRVGQLQ